RRNACASAGCGTRYKTGCARPRSKARLKRQSFLSDKRNLSGIYLRFLLARFGQQIFISGLSVYVRQARQPERASGFGVQPVYLREPGAARLFTEIASTERITNCVDMRPAATWIASWWRRS